MFTVFQIPFVDVRPFAPTSTFRLPVPTWPVPIPDKEFIRSSGAIKKRIRGGLDVWAGEDVYCEAHRAIRFPSPFPRFVQLGKRGPLLLRKSRFRRFLTDGEAVSRVEVGLEYHHFDHTQNRLNQRNWIELIKSVCCLPIRVSGEQSSRERSMISADFALAKHYLRATTQRRSPGSSDLQDDWLRPGEALLLIEYDLDRDAHEMPKHSRHVRNLQTAGLQLAHLRIRLEHRHVGVWLLGISRESSDKDYVRKLRMHLFRLHAHREAVKEVFRWIVSQDIRVEPGSTASDQLQRFLLDAVRILNQKQRSGLPHSEMMDVVQQFEDVVSVGERATLLSSLAKIRPNILRNVTQFTRPRQMGIPVYQIVGEQVALFSNGGEMTMNNQQLTISGGVSGTVNQTAAGGAISHSLNTLHEGVSGTDIKQYLAELHAAVEGIATHLPARQQKEVQEDLRTFSEQALSEDRRKAWYTLSAEGLLAAAKAVGDIGEPVTRSVRAILNLLA